MIGKDDKTVLRKHRDTKQTTPTYMLPARLSSQNFSAFRMVSVPLLHNPDLKSLHSSAQIEC